jgi:hypothetical protein
MRQPPTVIHSWVNAMIAITALVYVIYRAATLSITYDEAWTILDFVPNSVIGIFTCEPCDANNHFLHTLSLKILFWITDLRSEFIARLPNILSFLLYLYFGHRICISRFRGVLANVGFLLLVSNPFVLDLFGLARGYGMALGLQVASLYYFLEFVRDRRPISAHLCMWIAMFAVLANLTQIYFLLAAIGLIILVCVQFRPPGTKKIMIGAVMVPVLLAMILYVPIKKMLVIEAFYYGGKTGLFQDTLRSLVQYSLYNSQGAATVDLVTIVFLVLLLTFSIIAIRRHRTLLSVPLMMLAMLLICLLAIELQHRILGTRYVLDRGALFLYPIMILLLCGSLNELPGRWPAFAGLSISVLFLFNLGRNVNLYKTVLWDHEAHTRSILADLEVLGKREQRQVLLDHSWPYRSAARYYQSSGHYPHVQFLSKPGGDHSVNHKAEYYIHLGRPLTTAYYEPDLQELDPARCDTILSFPAEDVYVLEDLYFR